MRAPRAIVSSSACATTTMARGIGKPESTGAVARRNNSSATVIDCAGPTSSSDALNQSRAATLLPTGRRYQSLYATLVPQNRISIAQFRTKL